MYVVEVALCALFLLTSTEAKAQVGVGNPTTTEVRLAPQAGWTYTSATLLHGTFALRDCTSQSWTTFAGSVLPDGRLLVDIPASTTPWCDVDFTLTDLSFVATDTQARQITINPVTVSATLTMLHPTVATHDWVLLLNTDWLQNAPLYLDPGEAQTLTQGSNGHAMVAAQLAKAALYEDKDGDGALSPSETHTPLAQ